MKGLNKRNCQAHLLGALLIACLVCIVAPASAFAFTDVTSSTPHAEDITWLGNSGISTGYPDGSYGCMRPVYRQDMAAFLRRLAIKMGDTNAQSWKPGQSDWNSFTDVNSSTDHAEDILWLAKTGISTGYKDNSFRPMTPVYRQDMAAFMRRLAKYLGDNKTCNYNDYAQNPGYFSDVGTHTDHCGDIWWLRDFGIATGYPNGTYRGMTFVYRQDMAAFIKRFYDKIEPATSTDSSGKDETPDETPTVSADLYVLGSGDGIPVYTDCIAIIFAKTSNASGYPDYQVLNASGQREPTNIVGMNYADVEDSNGSTGGWRKVDGGYICYTEFSTAGVKTFNFRIDGKVVASLKINVVDGEQAAGAWMDKVLASVTTSNMDPFEKMSAVQSYLLKKFRYSLWMNDKYVNLAQYQVPYWISYRWNSYISPEVLCEFAKKIGGFDDIHNCYYDYEYGSSEWQDTHFLCKVTCNGETRAYWACPDSSTGEISGYSKIDFNNLNQVLHFNEDALYGLRETEKL